MTIKNNEPDEKTTAPCVDVKPRVRRELHYKILEILCNYEAKTGIKPTKLYVGKYENKEILRILNPIINEIDESGCERMRSMYCGAYIYVVNSDSYLDCA